MTALIMVASAGSPFRAILAWVQSIRLPAAAEAAVRLGNIAIIHGCYLPESICRPPEFKNAEAVRAIFAARMAFSSLFRRSRLM